jgi:hypothetical protein
MDYNNLQDVLSALQQNPGHVDLTQVTSEEILDQVALWVRKQPGFLTEKQYLLLRGLNPHESLLAKIDPEAAETLLQALIEQQAPVGKLVYPFLCTKINTMAVYLGSREDLCDSLVERVGSCYGGGGLRYEVMLELAELEKKNVLEQGDGEIRLLQVFGIELRGKKNFGCQTAVVEIGADNIPQVVSISDAKPFKGLAKTPEGYRDKCFR